MADILNVLRAGHCRPNEHRASPTIDSKVKNRPSPSWLPLPSHCLANRLAQTGVTGQLGGLVRGFPGEVRIVASKMAVSRGLAVDGPPQIERLDNALGREFEIGSYQV